MLSERAGGSSSHGCGDAEGDGEETRRSFRKKRDRVAESSEATCESIGGK